MVSGRRPSFDDVVRQRLREFEAALDQQRQAIARDVQRRLADIERATIGELEMLEAAAADKTAEIHWVAAEQRGALDQAAAARTAELERAAREERAAFEDLAGMRLVALEDALRAQFEALRAELVDEARRARDTTLQAAAFDEIAGLEVPELQERVREQMNLLDELTGLHASASEHLAEARALTAGALRSGMEGLHRDVATALRQTGRPERTSAAAATTPEVSQPTVPTESSPPVSTSVRKGDEAEVPPVHWTAPPPSPGGG